MTTTGGKGPVRVRLSNGHLLVAIPPRRREGRAEREWQAGEVVRVHLTPYDLSRGRIILD